MSGRQATNRRSRPWNPNRPLRPDRCPFYYGWIILGASSLGILASIPGQTMGVSVFSDHLISATGLSRLQLSNAYLIGTLSSGVLLPLGGRALARWGERRTAVFAAFGLALALCWLASSDVLSARLAGATAGSTGSSSAGHSPLIPFAFLALGFTLLRFCGQGMLTLSSRNLVPKWFERRRGLAAGISGALVSLGFSLAPRVLAAWIQNAGSWRLAWFEIAAALAGGMTLFAWTFYRDDPESCGLQLDGELPIEDSLTGTRERRASRRIALPQALRSGAFWAVTLSLGLQSAMVTGFTFHIVDIGASVGLEQDQILSIFLPIAILGVLAGIAVGTLSDRVRLRVVLAFYLVALTVGYAALAGLGDPFLRSLAIGGLGAASGCFGMLTTVAAAKLFGRVHLGPISSVQMSFLVITSALGPSLFALSRSLTGSYGSTLLVGAGLPTLIAVLMLFSKDPGGEQGVW